MNCSFCGIVLQAAVARCPSCGSPTAYATQPGPQHGFGPTSGMAQPTVQQAQTGGPDAALTHGMEGHQQHQQYTQAQQLQWAQQAQAFYTSTTPADSQTSQTGQGTAGAGVFPPLSMRQSGKQQASKLSDYKPAGQSLAQHTRLSDYKQPSVTGNRLSDYKQPSVTGNRLSDYKQPSVTGNRLSDYKQPVPMPAANSMAGYNTVPAIPPGSPVSLHPASMPPYTPAENVPVASPVSAVPMLPTTGPGLAYTAPSYPGTPAFLIPSTPPAVPNLPGSQAVYANPPASLASVSAQYMSIPGMGNAAGTPPAFNMAPSIPGAAVYNPSQAIAEPPTHTRSSAFLLAIIAAIVLAVCTGGALTFLLPQGGSPKSTAGSTKVAPTPVPTVALVRGPSGNTSVPAASALFSPLQMASDIDDANKAKKATESFKSKQTIYVTFTLNSDGQNGYVKAKWYRGKQLFKEIDLAHDARRSNAYFSIIYDGPTTDGSVELYWSTSENSSDAKLARVAHFTVSD